MKNKPIANPISERLDRKLRERGMTAYLLCKRTGYAEGMISVAKTRKNSFGSAVMLYDFARELGITSDELISGVQQITEKERFKELEQDRDHWQKKYEDLSAELQALKNNLNKIK